jgi:hypothetical protein
VLILEPLWRNLIFSRFFALTLQPFRGNFIVEGNPSGGKLILNFLKRSFSFSSLEKHIFFRFSRTSVFGVKFFILLLAGLK